MHFVSETSIITYERHASPSVGSFSCGGQNQNSELNIIVGSGRKAPIHEKPGASFVSTTATLWAASCCYRAMLFRAYELLLASHASRKICTYIQVSNFKKSVCIEVHTPSLCFLLNVKLNLSEQD